MRDRLIELLINTPELPITVNGRAQGRTYQTFANIADHLLAEGVIVPPYKPLPLVWPDDEFAQEVLCPICETDLMGCYIDGEEAPTVVTCYHCGAWLDSTKAVPMRKQKKRLRKGARDDTQRFI